MLIESLRTTVPTGQRREGQEARRVLRRKLCTEWRRRNEGRNQRKKSSRLTLLHSQAQGQPGKSVERLPTILKDIESQRNSIKTWGVVGFCWGGKVVNLSSNSSNLFKAAAVAHPAMVDAADAGNVKIPFLMLPSKDEPKEDVDKWAAAIKSPSKVEWFPNQIHGWLAARGDLKDSAVEADYKKGYELILNWFHQYL